MVEPNWTQADWRKSRRSADGGGGCVEFAYDGEDVGMRDSKNPDGPILVFHQKSWREFIDALKRGDFDQ